MKLIGRSATFLFFSTIYAAVAQWVASWVYIGSCGLGPDATEACYQANEVRLYLAGIGLFLIWIAGGLFFVQRCLQTRNGR